MNLRSGWGAVIKSTPISGALDYLAKRINLVFNKEHTPNGGHLFTPATPLYDATHHSGNAAMTWVVTATDVVTLRVGRIGTWAVVEAFINGVVGGTPNTQLRFQLPSGVVAAFATSNPCWVIDGGVGQLGLWNVGAGGTILQIFKGNLAVWTTGAAQYRLVAMFEVR